MPMKNFVLANDVLPIPGPSLSLKLQEVRNFEVAVNHKTKILKVYVTINFEFPQNIVVSKAFSTALKFLIVTKNEKNVSV